ncbi:hypothetical protein ILYODFUR_021496 [Ilyodon furcidens]|uniref:Uncharacterized protein n=1 Tax=Ilyodon furcidens TaxID=33524 RepID=A0ABV0T9X6_9TELE
MELKESELHGVKYNRNRHASAITKSRWFFSKLLEHQFSVASIWLPPPFYKLFNQGIICECGFLFTQNENILAWVISSQKHAEFSCNVFDHMGICFREGKEIVQCCSFQAGMLRKKRGDGGDGQKKKGQWIGKLSAHSRIKCAGGVRLK